MDCGLPWAFTDVTEKGLGLRINAGKEILIAALRISCGKKLVEKLVDLARHGLETLLRLSGAAGFSRDRLGLRHDIRRLVHRCHASVESRRGTFDVRKIRAELGVLALGRHDCRHGGRVIRGLNDRIAG